ncbi:MAG TPA: aminoacyl--tRNA ligase-related protein [Candidatus Saccharimonadales bacterium]|nr:aminoacyl--tRNA ligase-related protein [Candidatus Saccharimonadales bacterium]
MRLSELFTKTSKTVPADETAKNAQLLIQAGFVHKEMAGVYAYLPLGLKVIENIKQIIREEMNGLGGQEFIMTSLQRKELWEKTDRWDDNKVDIWFKSKLKNGTDVGLAWSHEEQITEMMRNYISSYRDLPAYVYQFQTKLRNEIRSKSGIMRGREFLMKDMYSYTTSDATHQKFYDESIKAYQRVFERIGLGKQTYLTFASGGDFTQFSHEFQTITDAGEDVIYLDRSKKLAVNQEVLTSEVLEQLGLKRDDLEEVKAAEVGNIFSFGGAKSEQLGLYFDDEAGHSRPVILGSYGIGVSRLMGVIAECFADDKGLVWPEAVAPAKVYLISLGNDPNVVKAADELYKRLTESEIAVLYDDRDVRAGQKFADGDLTGVPYRIVVSDKTTLTKKHELKPRTSDKTSLIDTNSIVKSLTDK